MRKTLITLLTFGALSGCGGEENATAEAGAPKLAMTLASTAESGEIIPIGVTVTDDEDKGLDFTLSCDGGTLTSTMLTTPVVSADMTIECTASATDSKGNVGTVKKTITVKPATAKLSSYTGSDDTVSAGGVGILFAQNLTLDEEQYTGTLNGRSITMVRANGNELLYVLPVDMAAGTGDLTVQIGSRVISTPVTVGAAIAVVDARTKLATFLQNARQQVANSIATAGISSQDRSQLEGALPQIDEALANLPNASDSEVSELATHLAALGLISSGTQRTSASYEFIVPGQSCGSDAKAFSKNLAKMLVGGYLVYKGAESALSKAIIPGAGWINAAINGVVIGTGVVLFTDGKSQFGPTRRAFRTSCWTETEINLTPWSDETLGSVRTVSAITLPGKPSFRQNVARKFKLQRSYAPSDSVSDQANQYYSDISGFLSTISFMPASFKTELQEYKVSGSEAVPANSLSLTNISSGKVSGTASADGDVITITFKTTAKTEDLTDGKLPFSFNLVRPQEETVIVNAEMSLTLPDALDAAVEVTQFEATASQVQTSGADTLEVTSAPAHGTVVLKDDGQFSYTPSGSYYGVDQFKYIARNADGVSREATVVVDVVRKFDGVWNVKLVSKTTYESTAGICPDEQTTFSTSVSKISDIKYSTAYGQYEIILTMGSKDDPGGPHGTKDYSETEAAGTPDEETETGSVSLTILDSQRLTGSNGWSWAGPNNRKCSGTTTITGTR